MWNGFFCLFLFLTNCLYQPSFLVSRIDGTLCPHKADDCKFCWSFLLQQQYPAYLVYLIWFGLFV